jgi:pimeloyl-ACP methyl ester carboxylesterase
MRARLNGAEIEYDVRGEGPAIVFLHAFPLGQFMWDRQVAALEATHRVARFDARGFGGSPPGDGPLTMDRIAEDAATLMDHLDIEKAVVAGCSMGGYAAFSFVRRHAHRLTGLVLQDTRPAADTDEARANRSALASRVLEEGAAAAAEAFLPKLVGETTKRENPGLVSDLRERILGTSPQGIARALAGLGGREDSTDTLRRIQIPTLVVVGEEDVLTPPSEAKKMAAAVAGSRLAVLPGAGHLSNLENPSAFDDALGSFLDSLR